MRCRIRYNTLLHLDVSKTNLFHGQHHAGAHHEQGVQCRPLYGSWNTCVRPMAPSLCRLWRPLQPSASAMSCRCVARRTFFFAF